MACCQGLHFYFIHKMWRCSFCRIWGEIGLGNILGRREKKIKYRCSAWGGKKRVKRLKCCENVALDEGFWKDYLSCWPTHLNSYPFVFRFLLFKTGIWLADSESICRSCQKKNPNSQKSKYFLTEDKVRRRYFCVNFFVGCSEVYGKRENWHKLSFRWL